MQYVSPGGVVAETGSGLIVFLAIFFYLQCRCGHPYIGVIIHLLSGYEFSIVGFEHYVVSDKQMCRVRGL